VGEDRGTSGAEDAWPAHPQLKETENHKTKQTNPKAGSVVALVVYTPPHGPPGSGGGRYSLGAVLTRPVAALVMCVCGSQTAGQGKGLSACLASGAADSRDTRQSGE
jgi:hypothetical protein